MVMLRNGKELAARIRAFLETGAGGADLYDHFERHVHVATATLPDHYFELGRRSPTALASLTSRFFGRATRTGLGRAPFYGRPALVAVAEDNLPDRDALSALIYGRVSVLREVIAADLARNLARDVVGEAMDDVYRRIGPLLVAHAVRVPGEPETWRSREVTPARPIDAVAAELRQYRGQSLEVLLSYALRLLGVNVTRATLAHLLAPVVLDPDEVSERRRDERERSLVLSIEDAVREAWSSLAPPDRTLLLGLVGGDDAEMVLGRDPRLEDPAVLNRALRRVSERFVGRVAAVVGDAAVIGISGATYYERIAEVTLRLLPELGGLHVT